MHSRPPINVAGTVVLLLFVGSCKVDTGLVEKRIAKGFKDDVGEDFKVTCPKLKDGVKTTCKGTLTTGEEFDIEVEIKGKRFEANYRGVIFGHKAERLFKPEFEKQYGIKLDSIKCAKMSPADKPAPCVAMAEGVEIEIDPKNGLPTKGIVFTEKLERFMTLQLAKRDIKETSCPKRFYVHKPGKRIKCVATGAASPMNVYATLDDKGSFRMHLDEKDEP